MIWLLHGFFLLGLGAHELSDHCAQHLRELQRLAMHSEGAVTLVNAIAPRNQRPLLLRRLRELVGEEFTIESDENDPIISVEGLLARIDQPRSLVRPPRMLHVTRLEDWIEADTSGQCLGGQGIFQQLNFMRERIFSSPVLRNSATEGKPSLLLIFWTHDEVLRALGQYAPDFWDYKSSTLCFEDTPLLPFPEF